KTGNRACARERSYMAVDGALAGQQAESHHPYQLSLPHADRRIAQEMAPHGHRTPALRRDALYRRALATGDLLALAATALLTIGVKDLRPEAIALVPLLVLAAKVMGLYDRDQVLVCKRTLDEAPGLFHLATLLTFVLWLGQDTFSRQSLGGPGEGILTWAALFVALVSSRAIARRFAQTSSTVERCLVVADADEHRRLAAKLELDPRLKSRVVAHLPLVDRRAGSLDPPHASLEHSVRTMGIHRVIVAPEGAEPGVVLDLVSRAKLLDVNVSILPRVCEVVGSSVEFDDLGGLTLLGVRPFRLARSSQLIKRGLDLLGAGLGLAVAAPFLALTALAIRLDSRGPAFYRQTRVGQDGCHFEMLKFRTMVLGAHAGRADLAGPNGHRELFKLANDPRVTRIGRLLRRTSLDELPQLLNVLRGEMSLVGPRPLILEEDAMVVGYHRRRLHLKPGLTGPWQVLGSPDVRVGVESMATIDYLYVVNWSLWADLQVILRTIAYVARGHGV
ncbi:MAG: exopolysaccharide biosynthesis polyprenyl glycosylphosphotransferase, partial [Solirubrobacteraceae bacterium]